MFELNGIAWDRDSPAGNYHHKSLDNCDLSDVDLNVGDSGRDLVNDRHYDSWTKTTYASDCSIHNRYRYPDTNGKSKKLNNLMIHFFLIKKKLGFDSINAMNVLFHGQESVVEIS